ncbi:O-antigen ligase family protein [Patescibacteria group bacterium]|nr:O-antigen ligase family protein [Patescibacteria group bacterium]MBU1890019.1 O-antigen ligase family protein [Patescibacteria group bacterium]
MMEQLKQLSKKTQILIGLGLACAVIILSFFIGRIDALLILGAVVALAVSLFIYRSPFLGLVVITFFLPFERIGSYDVAGITIRISQLLTLILIVAWLARGIINRNLKIARSPIAIPMLVFLLVNILALTNALNLERALLVLAFTAFTMLFSYMVTQLVTDEERLTKVIRILLITTTIVCLFGVWQFFGDMIDLPTSLTGLREHYTKDVFGFPRIQSTALEPLYFANFLLLPISLLFVFLVSRSSAIKKIWLLPLFVLAGLNMVLTVSRGGYLGVAVILLVIGLFYLKKMFRWKFLLSLIAGVAVVWVVAVYALGFGDIFRLNSDTFLTHVQNAFSGPAYIERVETIEWAQQAWLDEPWIGIGPGQYGPYVSTHPYVVPDEGWKIVNNEFIELLAETGILGLVSFVVILLLLITRSIKAIMRAQSNYLKAIMVALLATLLGVIAQYQTFSILYIMHIWFLIGLMVAVQNIILKKISHKTVMPDNDSASPRPPKKISTNTPQS